MISLIVYAAPFILIPLALFSVLMVVGNFRQARTAPYFRIRRSSTTAGWRWVLMVIVCGGGAAWSLASRGNYPPPDLASLLAGPTPGATPPPGEGGTPTATSQISLTPGSPLEGPPTITPILPPGTQTVTPPFATIESEVTPPPDATLTITAVARDISASLAPVEPGDTFPAGITRLCVFFDYSNMVNGVSVSYVLSQAGTPVWTASEIWTRGTEGPGWYCFDRAAGFPGGNYQVQLYLGDQLEAQAALTLE